MTDLLQLYERRPSPPSTGSAHADLVELRQTLVPMLDGLSRSFGYERALVALHDPVRETLRGSVGLNVPEEIAESLEVPLASNHEHPFVRALLEGTPQRIDDVATEPALSEHNRALLLEMGMTSVVVAPLRRDVEAAASREAAEGGPVRDLPALGVVLLSKEQGISDEDIEWLMPFATQAGVALARASDVEALRSSSEQHAIESEWLWWMVNAVDDPVVLTDTQGEIIMQNRRAETIFRASAEDSEGKRHAIRMNNFLFTAAQSSWGLDPSRRGTSRELTLVDPIEGTELLFEVLSYPVTHYRLGARGLVSVLKDVTDLRRATEQLTQNVHRLQSADEEIRLERDRLNLILRSVPNPIIVVDNDNQIVTMNQEALRIFRPIDGAALAGTISRRDHVSLSNAAKFSSFLAQLRLDPAQLKSGELALVDPDGEEPLAMWVRSTEIRDDLGAVTAIVSVMQNLAPLRELERRRVEQALFDSEKLAATGRLAASIAHEINNPLEAIKNSLYLLVNKSDPSDPNHQFLEIAKKETERVSGILRQLLGFYRGGGQTPTTVATDVNALIVEAEALVDRHLRARGVRIQNELDPRLPSVRASPDQLKQVILNLLLNAQEAMPGGGTIHVSTHFSREADREFLMAEAVYVLVRDTGSGIAEEHLPHIFEPFFSTKEGKGTGLGLWVSYGIVQSHGGNIRVRSRPGRGTTFTISLPINGPPDGPSEMSAGHAER
ncbi:MAG TPA: ATP-binding protein [Chloroflexota bacterium]